MKPKCYKDNEPYVFVSYSHKDAHLVYPIIEELQAKGVRIWYDEGLTPSKDWYEVVRPKIVSEQCVAVLFFVSPYFFTSESILEEVEIVFLEEDEKLKKNYFQIHLHSKSIVATLVDAYNLKDVNFLDKNTVLTQYFKSRNTFLEPTDPNYINKILQGLVSLGCIDERYEQRIIAEDTARLDVLFIGKDSLFANSLVSGMETFFSSQTNVHFEKRLVSGDDEKIEKDFLEIIDYEFIHADAFIIRLTSQVSHALVKKLKYLIDQGRIVLLIDRNLDEKQLKLFGEKKPLFVSGNFTKGGEMISEKIKLYQTLFPNQQMSVFVLKGPMHVDSLAFRMNALVNSLEKEESIELITIDTNTFDTNYNAELLESFASLKRKENLTLTNKFVFFVFPNDHIASRVIDLYLSHKESALKSFLISAENLVFVGYDGIRNLNNEVFLKRAGLNIVTIDSLPDQIGLDAAKLIIKARRDKKFPKIILTEPKLISTINVEARGKDCRFIFNLIQNKKVLIFDLDGTMANTEPLHWQSYNELLASYDIVLKEENIVSYIGNSEQKIWRMINKDFQQDFDIDWAIKRRNEILIKIFKKSKLQPFEYFRKITQLDLKSEKMILTSQRIDIVHLFLKEWNLEEYFKNAKIISLAEVNTTKKEVLKNIKTLFPNVPNLRYEDVTIFEDAPKVLEIATSFGMSAVGVEHHFNKNKLHDCKYVINELDITGLFIGLAGIDIIYYQDELPKANEKVKTNEYTLDIGGPAANAARTYAQLGGNAILVTAIGQHFFGCLIKELLKKDNITVIDVLENEQKTPNISSVIINKENGERSIFSGQIKFKDVNLARIIDAINLSDFVLYDCNLESVFNPIVPHLENKTLIIDAGSYKEHLEEIFPFVDIVISSEKFSRHGQSVLDFAKEFNFAFVAMSRGEKSTKYLSNDKVLEIMPEQLSNVVDTLGAGDILHGAFCYYKYYEKLDNTKALEKAMKIATLSTKYQGFPNIKELSKKL